MYVVYVYMRIVYFFVQNLYSVVLRKAEVATISLLRYQTRSTRKGVEGGTEKKWSETDTGN